MGARTKPKGYHHGDLRRALLDAGEAELAEAGPDGFSLRRVAARVGVSHTAPSHHFGDAAGLIEALAERGFLRLLACMEARAAAAPDSAEERLLASALGYLDFALANPALFKLAFGLKRQLPPGEALRAAGSAAYMHLAHAVAATQGAAPLGHPDARDQVLACWTRAHGFAELILAGHIDLPDTPAEREALFRRVFTTHMPRC